MTPGGERRLKVGVVLPLFSGDTSKVLVAAREAEALGFDGVFAFDHFFPPGSGPERPALEAFTALAMAGAVTDRVALGTLVTRAVLRPPGQLAKMAATVDHVTRGRMILGMGTGDPIDHGEHQVFGFPDLGVRERREHFAETVAAIKALFGGEPYRGGRHVGPVAGPLLPPPVRPGGPPIWVGAQAEEMIRMAGRTADGWNGWGHTPDVFGHKAALLAGAARHGGPDPVATWAGIALVGADGAETERLLADRRRRRMEGLAFAGTAEQFVKHLASLADAGARWAILVLAGPADRRRLIAERVLPQLG